jgi:hypothetical protein
LCVSGDPSDGRGSIISPLQSRRAVEQAITRTSGQQFTWFSDDGERIAVSLPDPTIRRSRSSDAARRSARPAMAFPVVLQRALESRGDDRVIRAGVNRPKVIFFTNRSSDS